MLEDRFNQRQMVQYFGMVKCIDDNLGRLIAALKETGQFDNTMLVFTSDHGDICGEHGRHNKGILCEGSARIPFVIAAPGIIPPGTVIHEALGTVDFKPSLLGLLGLRTNRGMQGRDASALFKNGGAPEVWKDRAFVRIGGGEKGAGGWVAVFTRRHNLVLSPTDDPALFDLDSDPFEMTNLFHDPAWRGLIRDIANELKDCLATSGDPHAKFAVVMADIARAVSPAAEYSSPAREKGRRARAEHED